MKRDLDLVREILLLMENSDRIDREIEIDLPGYAQDLITYNLKMMKQAGLIEAIDATCASGPAWIPTSLTWSGHEFLESARNKSTYQKAVKILKDKVGGLPFDLLKTVLTELAKNQLPHLLT